MKKIYKSILYIYHRIRRGEFGTNRWKRKFAYFGNGTAIGWPADVSLNKGKIYIDDNSIIKKNSRIQNYLYAENWEGEVEVKIGKGCYICKNFSLLNASRVELGDNVLIASDVLITSENHSVNPESSLEYKDQPLQTVPVKIGDGCWIGEKVVILPGVSIGKKCVIGAASVVTKSIPDYCMAVGNPAKVIKKYDFIIHSWNTVNN